VFDEVWRFFAQSKGFLEEMYRTLRKYKAGIGSITQSLADYGEYCIALAARYCIFEQSLSGNLAIPKIFIFCY
jgi:hypothetical protein